MASLIALNLELELNGDGAGELFNFDWVDIDKTFWVFAIKKKLFEIQFVMELHQVGGKQSLSVRL